MMSNKFLRLFFIRDNSRVLARQLSDNFKENTKKIDFVAVYYYNITKGLNVRDKEWRRYR